MALIFCLMSSVALARLPGEFFHFVRDHRETLAGFSGARGLDGRIQG